MQKVQGEFVVTNLGFSWLFLSVSSETRPLSHGVFFSKTVFFQTHTSSGSNCNSHGYYWLNPYNMSGTMQSTLPKFSYLSILKPNQVSLSPLTDEETGS